MSSKSEPVHHPTISSGMLLDFIAVVSSLSASSENVATTGNLIAWREIMCKSCD